MKELVELIVKELVEDKEAVSIEENRDGGEEEMKICCLIVTFNRKELLVRCVNHCFEQELLCYLNFR